MDDGRDGKGMNLCEYFVIQSECNKLSENKCCRETHTKQRKNLRGMRWVEGGGGRLPYASVYRRVYFSFILFPRSLRVSIYFSFPTHTIWLPFPPTKICSVSMLFKYSLSIYKIVEVKKAFIRRHVQENIIYIGSNICGKFLLLNFAFLFLVGILYLRKCTAYTCMYVSYPNRIVFFSLRLSTLT